MGLFEAGLRSKTSFARPARVLNLFAQYSPYWLDRRAIRRVIGCCGPHRGNTPCRLPIPRIYHMGNVRRAGRVLRKMGVPGPGGL